jgi:hypothetical protein
LPGKIAPAATAIKIGTLTSRYPAKGFGWPKVANALVKPLTSKDSGPYPPMTWTKPTTDVPTVPAAVPQMTGFASAIDEIELIAIR